MNVMGMEEYHVQAVRVVKLKLVQVVMVLVKMKKEMNVQIVKVPEI
jgi:hypothetical protein